MLKRKLILVAGSPEDLEVLKFVHEAQGAVDITEAVPLLQYVEGKRDHPTRTAIGMKLEKRLPAKTHDVVSVLFPLNAGENTEEWERRVWMDPVMSLLGPSYRREELYAGVAYSKLNPSPTLPV